MSDVSEVDPLTAYVGQALQEARTRSGLTFQALHERSGLAKSAIQNWLDGSRSPRLRDVKRLCDVMGVPYQEVVVRAAELSRQTV